MKSYKKTTLDNGLRIITVPHQDSLAVTLLVLVEAGSKYETKEINGLSHFLEHMCFKGTTNRPKAIMISSELDGLGAAYNAFTGQEYTGYYAKAQPQHLDKVIEIVSDLYLNPIFDQAEIEKEKGVIIEEINMYEDLPPRKVEEVLQGLMYGDQPAGWPIAGQKEIIRKLGQADFLKYRGQHYLAQATIVVMAGKFDEAEAIEKLDRAFQKMTVAKKAAKEETREKQVQPALKIFEKKSDQSHIAIGCRAFSVFDDRKYALDVLADALGGGMSSRLFQKVRDQLGAAYYVRAETDYQSDLGLLVVRAGLDNTRLELVSQAILEEMSKFTEKAISSEELQKAKDHLSGNFILGLETSDALATFYGGQEVVAKKIETPEEILRKIQAVTAVEILAVAKEVINNERLNFALVGPSPSLNLSDVVLFK